MANLVFDFLHHYQRGERRESDPANTYQYDEGHVIEAVLPETVTSVELHYWARGMEEAEAYTPSSITTNNDGSCTVIGSVPNRFFETDGDLRVYIVVNDAEASITTYEGKTHVVHRAMPDDYVDDDPENEATRVLTEAQAAATTATQQAQAASASAGQAQQSAQTLSQSVEQIATNTQDITQLKEDIDNLDKYDDVTNIIKITSTSTTLGDIATILNSVNTVGDHVFFDMSALGVMMYLCTIYIDTSEGVYKVFDLVSGRYAEGSYDASALLTMATAQANGLAVQSQIDYLQEEIDELGGKSVLSNLDVLGDMIRDGTSTDLIEPGDMIDFNWIKSVLGTTTSGLTVNCTDMDAFINAIGEAEEAVYLFVYDGTNWTYNGEAVNLANYALTVSGTPSTGEVMTIKTTVTPVSYTFVSYDTVKPSDSNVVHNWCLEETYAPNTKAYDTYEALFAVYPGKSVPVGNYHLRSYSYRSGFYVDMYLSVTSAIGDADNMIQARSNGYLSGQTIVNADNVEKTGVYVISGLTPTICGTRTNASGAVTIAYTPASGVSYTELSALNTDANDPVVYTSNGIFDKAVFGSNVWPRANLSEWANDETGAKTSVTPTYPLDVPSAYNLGAGGLWGLDPRVKALIQYASVLWTAGYGNDDSAGAYAIATGTAPSSNAPTYYERSGQRGAWVYTALDPQPSADADVSGYYVYTDAYQQGKTYETDQKVFLLSMKEMSFNIQTDEGAATQLYSEYTNNVLTNDAVSARAKTNKAGGSVNSYRWSRSGLSGYAHVSWVVSSAGSYSGSSACDAFFYARAFILGKSSNQ